MEWTDASGAQYNGTTIPPLATDTTGGAFPRGSVRRSNVGSEDGKEFDLLVTVSDPPTYYSDLVDVEYWNPLVSTASQAVLTSSGFACLGLGLRTAYCESGSALDDISTECTDGTPTTMRGGEFHFRFVEAGTSVSMPAFERVYASFYDVDGDFTVRPLRSWGLRELVSVLGATGRTFAPSSTLEGGVFLPSEALYARATDNVNVPVDLSDAVSPSAASLPAVASFEITAASSFKVLLGGVNPHPLTVDLGYCFAMVRPALGVDCPK